MTGPGGNDDRPSRAPRRSAARLAAVQALYQMDMAGTDVNEVIEEFMVHRFGHDVGNATYRDADSAFFGDIVTGAVRIQRQIDPMIDGQLAQGWRLKRVDSILRAILRCGAYELIARPDVPAKVVINEYVDVAHAFFNEDEPKVVNGVLDHLARRQRRTEFGQAANG